MVVVASGAGPGLKWIQAVRYLPSIDTPAMRDWLDRQTAGREGAVVMLAPGAGFTPPPDTPYREIWVPPHEFDVFRIASRSIRDLPKMA